MARSGKIEQLRCGSFEEYRIRLRGRVALDIKKSALFCTTMFTWHRKHLTLYIIQIPLYFILSYIMTTQFSRLSTLKQDIRRSWQIIHIDIHYKMALDRVSYVKYMWSCSYIFCGIVSGEALRSWTANLWLSWWGTLHCSGEAPLSFRRMRERAATNATEEGLKIPQ